MKKNNKRIIFITAIIVLIIIVIFFIIVLLNTTKKQINYDNLLENKDYDIIYEVVNNDNQRVPYININNSLINNINQEIDSMYQFYTLYSAGGFKYDYNINGNILSIIIESYVVQPESTHSDIIFKSYNIDLRNNKLLTDKEILSIFNISEEKMKFFLNNKFLNYYNDLIKNNYFTKEQCDFKCFLVSKNIDNVLDDNYYYINNNHLELYKYFNIYTEYNEEYYFNNNDFHFDII